MAVILIVDDDPTVRAIAAELLRADDHALIEAEDGKLALQVIAAVPIDLIVLDLLMPNVDGLEVIRSVRQSHPDIRILAISSGGRSGAQSYLDAARAFGADDTLMKPLRLATFADKVNRLLLHSFGQSDSQGSDSPELAWRSQGRPQAHR